MKLAQTLLISALSLGGFSLPFQAYADVPVIDALQTDSQPTTPAPSKESNAVTTAGAPEAPLPQAITTTSKPLSIEASSSRMSVEQRLGILERQMSNMTQMDMLGQINGMQQQIDKLRGELDTQAHQLQQLTDQVRSQYQDLDQRLSQASKKPAADKVSSSDKVTASDEAKAKTTSLADATPPDAPATNPAAELKAYQAANKLLKERDYVRASSALQNFILKYPKSSYTPIVHYRLGEVYLIQGQPDAALGEFQVLIEQYPKHSRVPDAMLGIGSAYADKGELAKAKVQWLKLKKEYPGSSAAQLANARLLAMKQGKGD